MLGEAWALYRRHAQHFLTISFVISLVIAIVSAVLSWALGNIGAIIGEVFALFGMYLLQAALVKAVQDARDNRGELSLGSTIEAVKPFVVPVAIASILASIGIAIGFALIIVPGLVLLTYWSLIVPEIVVGGAGAFESFGRSWRTVSGYAWRVFGTFVLLFLILIAADIVVSVILLVLPYGWRSFVSSLVVDALVLPFIAAVVTLIYDRLTSAHTAPAAPADGYGPYSGT